MNILVDIIQYDSRVRYKRSHVHIHDCNHSFVFHISVEISWNIAFEVAINRVMKLHNLSQFYYLNPLDATKKCIDRIRIDWHRIHDLSHSYDHSINDEIPEAYKSLIYQILNDTIYLIQKHEYHCMLRKRDLQDIFHMIPINSLNY